MNKDMKKFVKVLMIVIPIVVVTPIVGCGALLVAGGIRNENYWKYSSPKGEVEKEFTPLGSYEVSEKEYSASKVEGGKVEVWYPSKLEEEASYPLVIMANGTGTKASQYKPVFRHLASWGFIVAGNEDENCRTGESTNETLAYLLKANEDTAHLLHGKIDVDHIGVAGHSQGGVGAINAANDPTDGSHYKAIFAQSCTSRFHADNLNKDGGGWSIDVSKISSPIMMVAGTGSWDAGTMSEYASSLPDGESQGICPLWWLQECYRKIPSSNDKVIARMKGKDHGDMLRGPDAYLTAWFRLYLKGETSLKSVFYGKDSELSENTNYQDVSSSEAEG